MTDKDRVTFSARITGRVQGVWFRGWTQRQAWGLGLDGWVRNEPDGSVRAVLSGDRSAVHEMIALLHRGPEGARVDAVETAPALEEALEGFEILR